VPRQQQAERRQQPQRDDETIWRDFGIELRRLRLERGLSAPKLAEASGVSRDAIHKLEAGGYRRFTGGPWELPNPRDDALASLARALGVKLEDWFKQVRRYDDRPRTQAHLHRRSPTDRLSQMEEELRETNERTEELARENARLRAALVRAGIMVDNGSESTDSTDEPATAPEPRRRRSPG
jgi:transcriptional regulator with XRE-family HTH domain